MPKFNTWNNIMVIRATLQIGFIGGMILSCQGIAVAGDEAQETDAAAEFARLADSEAESYIFDRNGDRNGFELQTSSKLNWTNPVTGSIRGRVFIWTYKDRPCAIASIFKFDEQTRITTEFHTLTNRAFRVKRPDGAEWSPVEESLESISLRGPSVASQRSARSVQMRLLARGFSAERIDSDGSKWKLRLLPQPLYRYSAPEFGVVDGAVFVLAQGTNPDVILMIEAVESDDGIQWRCLTARMHRSKIILSRSNEVIQEFPEVPRADLGNPRSAYSVLRRNP